MSGKVSGWVWDQDIPREEKYILLAYADHADHDGENIFPSVGLIAKKTGYSKRHVQRINVQLKNKGLLIEVSNSRYKTKLYKIPINAWGDRVSPPADGDDVGVTPGVPSESSPDDVGVTHGVTSESPEPSLEPSNENVKESSVVSYDQTPWVMALSDVRNSHYRKNKAQWETSPWVQTWVVAGSDGHLVVGCTTEDDAAWLTDRGSALARSALTGVLGRQIDVEFLGPTALKEVMANAA